MSASVAQDRGFFGHPSGLSTLFFTEMWERFSYYGMRAFLILYMVTPVADGGLGFSDPDAASIYGTYTGSVWGAAILGGIVADRFLGQYRSVLIGGIIIALGHFTLAFKALPFFYTGLALIVVGTGLLKPNVSTLVGSLYRTRRPASRRRVLDFLHGHQPRRLHGTADRRLSGAARRLAHRVRLGRHRHGVRSDAVHSWPRSASSPPSSDWRRNREQTVAHDTTARAGCPRHRAASGVLDHRVETHRRHRHPLFVATLFWGRTSKRGQR